jgi:hypothetical protein
MRRGKKSAGRRSYYKLKHLKEGQQKLRMDPYFRGNGFGIVIHEQKKRTWKVARVLMGSPAQTGGVCTGDLIISLDGYPLDKGDIAEVLLISRSAKSRRHSLLIRRPRKGTMRLSLNARPIRGLVSRDLRLGGSLGGYCSTCINCWPTTNGWQLCGPPGCSLRCAVV